MDAIVQRYTTVDDGYGGEEYKWVVHITMHDGTLDKLSGDEVIASDRLGVLSSHIFIVFRMYDVNTSDRMIIDNKIYNIKDVDNPNNLNRQLEISLEYTGDVYVQE